MLQGKKIFFFGSLSPIYEQERDGFFSSLCPLLPFFSFQPHGFQDLCSPHQGLSPYPLRQKVKSQPLDCQGNLRLNTFKCKILQMEFGSEQSLPRLQASLEISLCLIFLMDRLHDYLIVCFHFDSTSYYFHFTLLYSGVC